MIVSIIIPALNEAEPLPGVLAAIPRTEGAEVEVIVVDNGSTDDTARVARESGAHVVSEPRRGYGFACAAGFRVARSKSPDVIVFMDADGSFDPGEMPALLEPLRVGLADVVLGARLLQDRRRTMPYHQRFGNWLAASMIRWLYGIPLTDLGPYRAVQADLLGALDMREMTLGWPTELIVKAARRGASIVEVPVHYYPRRGGQSKVSGTLRGSLQAGYLILRTTLRNVG